MKEAFALSRLGNVERFSYAFPDGRYLNLSLVFKHMLGAWQWRVRGVMVMMRDI
jgi:hypothetical protein